MRSERAAPLLLQCLRQSAHHSPFSALVGVVTPSKFSKSYRREQHRVAAPMAREASQRKRQTAPKHKEGMGEVLGEVSGVGIRHRYPQRH